MGAIAVLAAIKVVHPAPQTIAYSLGGLAVLACVGLAVLVTVALRRRHPLDGAGALDRFHELNGRVSNALAFAKEQEPSAWMRAAIGDAERFASELAPRRAVPLPAWTRFSSSVLLLAALFVLGLTEVRNVRTVAPAVATFVPAELGEDDLAFLRASIEDLERRELDAETADWVRRFNQVVTDLADRRLDRKQVLERLGQLEQGLIQGTAESKAGLDEGLDGLASALKMSRLSQPTAEALTQKNLADAEQALRELARKLKEPQTARNKEELERLRKALAAASTANAERTERLAEQRRSLEQDRKRLLEKKAKSGELSAGEQGELSRKERELKRLERQQRRSDAAQQQMSELDRELAKAAEALRKELGEAGKSLESGAERLSQLAKQQLTNEDKEALKKQIEQLREMLRQAKQSGQQKQLMERFRQRAGGGQQQAKGGQGQSGQGKPGSGQPGAGQQSGRVTLGGMRRVEVPVESGAGAGAANAGQGASGPEWGTGSSPNLSGDETKAQGRTHDVSAAGIDSGEGAAASEVVFGAAERGFVGRGYRKVYTEYHTVAEETLGSDEIPPGYKFYVRRYFQLIRPRE